MEDFKSSPKMQCFKEGGSVKYKSRHSEKSEMSEDIAKDTKMIKKGVKQHESALHKGEPKTELKLKKGGRMKKEGGCVGRYKKGGEVKKYNEGGRALYDEALQTRSKTGRAGVEAAKESTLGKPSTPEQKEMIKKESIKLGTLDFPYSKKTSREFSEMKKGGKIKKYADGSIVGQGAISDTERMRLANRAKNRAMLSPMQQQELDAQEAAAAAATQKGGMVSDSERGLLGKLIGRKKGGKAC